VGEQLVDEQLKKILIFKKMKRIKIPLSIFRLVLPICFGTSGFALFVKSGDIPKGRLEKFEFRESKIFPGTVREVTVYIPQQIDPSIPACVYVQQDGFDPSWHFNDILDTLIQTKEVPVTVGIFIKPGYLLPALEGHEGRPNRCFEYDGLGDNYVRFLLEEIIPYVADKYHLNLSHSGNDRCIGGCSSGGISSFNTAWERPDAFSRVYCNSGSFVAFRGGNEFPTLIRKTEAKPIRVFLTTGSDDMENCAGDWFLIDHEIDKALKFSGYEYQFHSLKGPHGVGWAEYFGKSMRYLWKDWPNPVKTGTSAPRVCDIIEPNETWHLVKEGYSDARGPACNAKGEVFFTDPENSKIYKIDIKNQESVFLENSGHCNSLSFGANGELYAHSVQNGKIMRYDSKGQGATYAGDIQGQYVLARPDGGLYVSEEANSNEPGKILFVKDGKKTVIDSGIKTASGIAISPDRWLLAVADRESHWVYSFTITSDGALKNKERFFWLHVQDGDDDSGAESICYDLEGHLYVATRMGIQICTWNGPTQVILPMPEKQRVTGVCIGGANFDLLFAFCGNKVYQRKIKNHTLGAFTPLTKMTQGKL
jgi:gluconolactonase